MNTKKVLPIVAGIAVVLAVIALLVIPKGGGGDLPPSKNVSGAELRDLVARGARLIDVRTAGEYDAGHIEGAENVAVDTVPAASAGWDKAAPVVVYCQSGGRSQNAAEFLTAQGFARVYDLSGGILAWDGETTTASSTPATGAVAATGRPIMYDFSSDT